MRRFVAYGPAFVVLLASLVVLFAAPALVRRVGYAHTAYTIELAGATLDEDDILERINKAVRAIAVKVEPSVVHIEARRDMGRFTEGSTGSGWVYDLDGHVVTNAHVVRDADTFLVHFFDGRVVEAERVGEDIYTDVAVLKVKASEGLFPARRATDREYFQGDRVYAFGSPFGFKFSMSQGIISGLGRHPDTAIEVGGYTNFIQTDAAVNPGNSGGPLIDVHGELIGMNVAIATGRDNDGTTEGQSSGISFAIPVATIDSVVPQLIRDGHVSRGYLGIRYNGQNVTRLDSGPYGVGVAVEDVVDGKPAAIAGLRVGDVIAEINGMRITSSDTLRSLIGTAAPGDTLRMRVWRAGAIEDVAVTLAEFPKRDLTVQSLNTIGIQLPESDEAPAVFARVGRFWPAWMDDFRSGQRILTVDDHRVRTTGDVIAALIDAGFLDGRPIPVEVIPESAGEEDPPLKLELQLAR